MVLLQEFLHFCLRSSATAVYTDVQAFLHAMNGYRVSTFCAKTWEAQRRFWRSRRSSGLLRKIPRSCPLCSREVNPEKMAPPTYSKINRSTAKPGANWGVYGVYGNGFIC